MSLFSKPEERKSGVKALWYGLEGSGKTVGALSFPGIALVDTEAGATWYEGTDTAKTLEHVFRTQSYREIQEAIEEIKENHKDMGIKTMVVDSMTKIRQGLVRVVTKVDEKREREKGKSVLEANTSMRSWGKIGQISSDIQNDSIDLSTTGVHVVHTAQAKAVYEGTGDSSRLVGYRPDVDKSAPFDYDIIVYFFKEEDNKGNIKFLGRIEKDRLNVFQVGDVVENVNYDMWKDVIEGRSDKKTSETQYKEQTVEDEKAYTKSEEEMEKTIEERILTVRKQLDKEGQDELAQALHEAGITKLNAMNKVQKESAEKVYRKFARKVQE